MIEVSQLEKRFGDVQAVSGVSFTAHDGEILGLLGPNGAGKTTTLRMIYGLITPGGGSVRVDGVDVARDRAEVQRRIGVLPDARGLYPRLTAREHVAYFARLQGMSETEIPGRVDELIEILDMGEIADRRAAGFSQGERAKVAIARALVHRPANVLLDEPTNGLDVMSTRAMREVVSNLKKAGHCVVFSSHVMQEVALLCDRVVVIASGRVVLVGTPEELIRDTGAEGLEDAFVAAIGSAEGLAS